MAYNFLRADRDQPFLLPPDLRDWLPDGHLAWFVRDVVDHLDLAPFYRAHRADGHGHPAYDPKLLLGVLLYAYCLGVRSSRQVERRCVEDLAFRVLAANQTADHVTIARFRARHETALAGFLVASLKLCAAAGMVRVGTVALDGTKLAGNAADKAIAPRRSSRPRSPRSCARPPRPTSTTTSSTGMLAGMSCPMGWPARPTGWPGCARPRPCWRPRRPPASSGMRSGSPPARRPQRPRAGHRGGSSPGARDEAPNPKATANVTDPDGRFLRTRKGSVQGYNAQAVTTEQQLVVAAELTQDANDVHQLEPMLQATAATLAAAGIAERPEALLADSGYWSIANLTEIPNAPELLIPPAKHGRQGKARKDGRPSESNSDGLRAAMTAKLTSEDGKARYAKRKQTVEPAFGQIKEQQGARRFLRRGLAACQAEWKLLCGTHNLLKLWRHTRYQQAPAQIAI
jgi:transposase